MGEAYTQPLETFEVGPHEARRMHAIMAIAPVAMLETTSDGCISWANKHWFELIGQQAHQGSEQTWFDMVHPDDRESVLNEWHSGAMHKPITLECRLRISPREYRWMKVHATQFVGSSRESTTYVVTLLDVTTQRRAAQLVQTTKDLETWAEQSAATLAQQSNDLGIFEALVQSIGDALVIVEPDGKLRYTNDTFRHWFDVTNEMSWGNLGLALGADDETQAALHHSSSTNESWQNTVLLKSPRLGTFPAEIRSFSIFDALSRKIGLAIKIRDMSAHEEAARERARLNAEIITAQEAAIRELSTPLLPIAPGILAMPIVGNIDVSRGRRILDVLLKGIRDHQSTVAILDVTGVRQVNADLGNILWRSAQAARLLGTSVVFTGISALFARALIELGVDLHQVKTMATLEQGIEAAFLHTRMYQGSRRPRIPQFSSRYRSPFRQ